MEIRELSVMENLSDNGKEASTMDSVVGGHGYGYGYGYGHDYFSKYFNKFGVEIEIIKPEIVEQNPETDIVARSIDLRAGMSGTRPRP